ncbi:methyltransferase domain-containing protein [Kibdelosporangium philippinense]|uniref:Methyltransferase domain-containing protein n=1 Tax=Kibdelosporangium philippinense TaxID=211113 RepID=A0ABS8Z859_9PSEU|nr:class I SAM-dependent methyltransferase [Kibdelosporangium philippinense]MCE7004066.1 methyltransferase domain-containing protein [Kibdelosporangium philippinense]
MDRQTDRDVSDVSNLLYRHPELYEVVYDGAGHAVAKLAETILHDQLGRRAESLLDIGCGTGRDLEYLATHIPDVVGVDHQQAMIDYARTRRPEINFQTGDMRTLRLERAFEAITCFGYALANIHANRDIDKAIATFAAHSQPGTVLILEMIDPQRTDKLPRSFTIDIPDLRAEAIAEYRHHYAQQLLERRRTWRRAQGLVHDHVNFRLIYPKELEHYLDNHGFEVLGAYELSEKLNAASAFVAARYRGEQS